MSTQLILVRCVCVALVPWLRYYQLSPIYCKVVCKSLLRYTIQPIQVQCIVLSAKMEDRDPATAAKEEVELDLSRSIHMKEIIEEDLEEVETDIDKLLASIAVAAKGFKPYWRIDKGIFDAKNITKATLAEWLATVFYTEAEV